MERPMEVFHVSAPYQVCVRLVPVCSDCRAGGLAAGRTACQSEPIEATPHPPRHEAVRGVSSLAGMVAAPLLPQPRPLAAHQSGPLAALEAGEAVSGRAT